MPVEGNISIHMHGMCNNLIKIGNQNRQCDGVFNHQGDHGHYAIQTGMHYKWTNLGRVDNMAWTGSISGILKCGHALKSPKLDGSLKCSLRLGHIGEHESKLELLTRIDGIVATGVMRWSTKCGNELPISDIYSAYCSLDKNHGGPHSGENNGYIITWKPAIE